MTIQLPEEIAISIEDAVQSGHFRSVDDALAEAWRCFQRQKQIPPIEYGTGETSVDPVLGSMREYANELDEIVADAMQRRQAEPWRVIPGE